MENKYAGMTVNERLYVSGLIDKFDKSVREEDVEEVKLILNKIEITDEVSISAILQQVGLQ